MVTVSMANGTVFADIKKCVQIVRDEVFFGHECGLGIYCFWCHPAYAAGGRLELH